MKIVDEKGKLFGKINVIDLLVVVLIAAALILLAVRFLAPGRGNVLDSTTKLTYTTKVSGVEQDVYAEVLRQLDNAGGKDQLMADGKLVDAYITGVVAAPHEEYTTDAQGNTVCTVEDFEGGRLDLTFTVEANVADPITNKVGTQEVRVAKNHIVKTVHFEFPYSTILTCDWG